MYALLGQADIDPTRSVEAEAMLRERLLPRVREMERFVSGTWTRSHAGWARSIVIFEDEASAERAAKEASRMAPPEGAPIRFRSFDVVEVVLQA